MRLMNYIRCHLPWWCRICAKIVLARLPIPYIFWKRLQLFEHGDMNQPQKAWLGFLEHAGEAGVLHERLSSPYLCVDGNFAVLELGPGDSLFSALIASTLGASHVWLVDAGLFATRDMMAYANMLSFLRDRGYAIDPTKSIACMEDILLTCNCQYLTNGTDSLALIPSESVDYCFSNAVLEHVPRHEFSKMVHELYRVLKPDGVCVHRVDLKDHLGGGLNSLRFSELIWEGSLFRRSGFYTNRIRFGEMLSIFTESGFSYTLPRVLRWKGLPISRVSLNARFSRCSDEDLLVSGFDVLLRKSPTGIN